MGPTTGIQFVAADHPSLAGDIDAFLRWIEPETGLSRSTADPSPTDSLRERGGFRMAAIECGSIIGLARIDGAGELFLIVAPEHRERGVGTALGWAMARRARQLHYSRLVLRASRRSRALLQIGEHLDAVVVEVGRGWVEVILDITGSERTA